MSMRYQESNVVIDCKKWKRRYLRAPKKINGVENMSTRYNKAKELSALKESTKKWVDENRYREVKIKSTGEIVTAVDYSVSPNDTPHIKVIGLSGNMFLCRLDDIDMG